MGFLVLARRINDKILIDREIEIMVSDIYKDKKGNLVADIAVKAPKKMKIMKQETYLGDLNKNEHKSRNKS